MKAIIVREGAKPSLVRVKHLIIPQRAWVVVVSIFIQSHRMGTIWPHFAHASSKAYKTISHNLSLELKVFLRKTASEQLQIACLPSNLLRAKGKGRIDNTFI